MDKITGKQNQLIKDTKKLLVSAKARRDARSFVLEGARLCFDVLHSFYTVALVLVTADCMARYPAECARLCDRADRAVEISSEVADKLAETEHTQGIFCVCKMPAENPTIETGRFIALDGVQDPSNLGAIARSAEALGIAGLLAYNCCDVYNPKALRASMGAAGKVPVAVVPQFPAFLRALGEKGCAVYAAALQNSRPLAEAVPPAGGGLALVIGNEGAGLSPEAVAAAGMAVRIPMTGAVESLNAAVAGSILLWHFRGVGI